MSLKPTECDLECEEELDENISEEDGRSAPDVMTKQTSKSEQDPYF